MIHVQRNNFSLEHKLSLLARQLAETAQKHDTLAIEMSEVRQNLSLTHGTKNEIEATSRKKQQDLETKVLGLEKYARDVDKQKQDLEKKVKELERQKQDLAELVVTEKEETKRNIVTREKMQEEIIKCERKLAAEKRKIKSW